MSESLELMSLEILNRVPQAETLSFTEYFLYARASASKTTISHFNAQEALEPSK